MMAANTGALQMPIRYAVTLTALTKRSRNSPKPTSSWARAMSMPPNTPSASANTVSSGSAINSAKIFGRTSTSSGAMPSVRMASISSVTDIVPICAA